MTEVLSMVFVFLLISAVSFAFMYLALKRKGCIWAIIATVLFTVNTTYANTIPFVTDSSGAIIGNSANIVLSGFSFLFVFMCLLLSVYYGFHAFKGRMDEGTRGREY